MTDATDQKPARKPAPRRRSPQRRLLLGTLGVVVLAAAVWFGIPWIRTALTTESTDDAFVNRHVTAVAARVTGQVSRVLVDDNNRVHKGDVLVRLDKEPFKEAVAVKRAAVDTADRIRGTPSTARAAMSGAAKSPVSSSSALAAFVSNVRTRH